MSMQHRLSDKVVVHADPWTFYCAVCSETMRIKTLAPSQGGMKTRTYRCSYECSCGHRHLLVGRGSRGVTEGRPLIRLSHPCVMHARRRSEPAGVCDFAQRQRRPRGRTPPPT
jgi:hypothetical protein